MRKIWLKIGFMVLIGCLIGAKGCPWDIGPWRDKDDDDDIITGSSGLPAQVTSPYPTDGATYLPVNERLSWGAANNATSYNVYFGTTSIGWTPVTNTTATSYKVGPLFASTTYYWRVDSKNAAGTTIGNVWSFRFDSVTNLTVGTPFQLIPITHTGVGWPVDIAYGNGKYFAVWNSDYTGSNNVYGRFVYLNSSLGPIFNVAANDYTERNPQVAYNTDAKKWIVVYDDFRSGSRVQYGRIFNENGVADGPSFFVSETYGYRASVVPIPNGFFTVVGLPTGYYNGTNIYGRVVYLNSTLGPIVEIATNTNLDYTADFPQAVYASSLGKILVVWYDNRTQLDGSETYGLSVCGRFLDTSGNPLGNDFVLVPDSPAFPQKPEVEFNDRDNTFIVAWEDMRAGGYEIWAQRFDADGTPIGNQVQVNNQDLGCEYDVDIAYNPVVDKTIFVWWVNTDMTKVKARLLNANGTFDGGQFDIPGYLRTYTAASRVDDSFIVHGGGDGVIIKVPAPDVKPASPIPSNGATNVPITQQLSWVRATGATSYDVYFGTTNPPPYKINTTSMSYNPGPLSSPNTTYYWRVDAKNPASTIQGDIWSFTTTGILTLDSNGVGEYTAIAIDSDNNVHISYYDVTNQVLKYATNKTGVWTKYSLDTSGNVGQYTSIALDSNDVIYISYYDVTNSSLKCITGTPGAWTTYTPDPDGSSMDVGQYSSIAVTTGTGKALIHIVYYNATNTGLRYVTTAPDGSWATPITIEGGPGINVGKYCSIAADSGNKLHVSYYDETNGDLKYATDASGSWVTSTVDNSADNVGFYSSLGVVTGGGQTTVHISYYNATNRDLKYTTNATGSWVCTPLVTLGDFCIYNSIGIAIDSNKNTHISYFSTSYGGQLKYATNAAGSWVYTTLDASTNNIGGYNSIVLDSNNKFHISYYDATNGDLKYATNASK